MSNPKYKYKQRDFSKPGIIQSRTSKEAETVEDAFKQLNICKSAKNMKILKEIGHMQLDDPAAIQRLAGDIDIKIINYFDTLFKYYSNKRTTLDEFQVLVSVLHMVVLSNNTLKEDPDFYRDAVIGVSQASMDYPSEYYKIAINPTVDAPLELRSLERLSVRKGICQYIGKPGYIGGTPFNMIKVLSLEERGLYA